MAKIKKQEKQDTLLPANTLKGLRQHLQVAIELEHATIPTYLTAMYSLKEDSNDTARRVIRSVVMEEMLHMSLASNLMNAIGGQPAINNIKFVPEYPTYLPHSDKAFKVNLQKFCRDSIETFLKIEHPGALGAEPQEQDYHTIGQFYEAIKLGLNELVESKGADKVFTGDQSKQLTKDMYYGGGGEVVHVYDLDSAQQAIDEIVDQGEGIHHTTKDGDDEIFGQEAEVAHYFRFNEIYEGRYYTDTDTPKGGPTGDPFPVDWDAVYPIGRNLKTEMYPQGSGLREKSHAFNQTYRRLLDVLHDAFNGKPKKLVDAVGEMYNLKYQALALMQTPVPGTFYNAAPTWEFVDLT